MLCKNVCQKNKGEKSIDISVTPNRPDCLGIRGIARDLSSSALGKLKKQSLIKVQSELNETLKKENIDLEKN